MIETKPTLNKRKSIFHRSASILTINENNIEKINLDDYELLKKLGKTNLSTIYICKSIKTNKIYSMKVIKKIDVMQGKMVERLTNEYKVLGYVYHPFIIELKGINNTNPCTLNFLFENIPGGNLSSLLK